MARGRKALAAVIRQGRMWTFIIGLLKNPVMNGPATAHLSSSHNFNAFVYYSSIKQHY